MPKTDQTVQEIYQNIVGNLSVSDRLRRAALILNDLARQNVDVIDASSTWTEQDQLELTSFSLQYANSAIDDLVGCVSASVTHHPMQFVDRDR